MPERIQRKRIKGWRMPPNTVYVGRPTIWGNPYSAKINPETAVKRYRSLLTDRPSRRRHLLLLILPNNAGRGEGHIAEMKARLPELRGKNLACWCPLDQPCHADVLLELANVEVECGE